MKYGAIQTLFAGDATAAQHTCGNTADANLTNVTANNPLTNVGGAAGVVLRVFCSGPGAGTFLVAANHFPCWQGVAGAGSLVFPAGGAGTTGSFEQVNNFPSAAYALAGFTTQALASMSILRPLLGTNNAGVPVFVSPHLFLTFTIGAAAVTGLTIQARCIYLADNWAGVPTPGVVLPF